MVHVLVAYPSRSGNAEKLARAVARGAEQAGGEVVVGDPVESGGHYGTACLGSPDGDDERAGEMLGARVVRVAGKLKGE